MENIQQKDFSAWECIPYDGDNKSKGLLTMGLIAINRLVERYNNYAKYQISERKGNYPILELTYDYADNKINFRFAVNFDSLTEYFRELANKDKEIQYLKNQLANSKANTDYKNSQIELLQKQIKELTFNQTLIASLTEPVTLKLSEDSNDELEQKIYQQLKEEYAI